MEGQLPKLLNVKCLVNEVHGRIMLILTPLDYDSGTRELDVEDFLGMIETAMANAVQHSGIVNLPEDAKNEAYWALGVFIKAAMNEAQKVARRSGSAMSRVTGTDVKVALATMHKKRRL
jgi:hypothetical protein